MPCIDRSNNHRLYYLFLYLDNPRSKLNRSESRILTHVLILNYLKTKQNKIIWRVAIGLVNLRDLADIIIYRILV